MQGGLTPLQTATIAPARAMNREKTTGSLDPGKQADLVLLDGDPLRQIRAVRRVQPCAACSWW